MDIGYADMILIIIKLSLLWERSTFSTVLCALFGSIHPFQAVMCGLCVNRLFCDHSQLYIANDK